MLSNEQENSQIYNSTISHDIVLHYRTGAYLLRFETELHNLFRNAKNKQIYLATKDG
jgi:hypothetical protein